MEIFFVKKKNPQSVEIVPTLQTLQAEDAEILTERRAEEHGDPHGCFYLLVLLLKDV